METPLGPGEFGPAAILDAIGCFQAQFLPVPRAGGLPIRYEYGDGESRLEVNQPTVASGNAIVLV